MKLATLKNGTKDGVLLVVSKDLSKAVAAPSVAGNLQQALDQWLDKCCQLEEIYHNLNQGTLANAFPFDPKKCESPLPRAYQWIDGSAYVNHIELVRKARGAKMPDNFWHEPLMYQGGSDTFLGPTDAIEIAETKWGIDFEAEVAVITNDVPMGVSVTQAKDHILLLMLVNDVSLRNLIPAELAKGFGFFQSKPSSAFSPVAVTPDELADSWDGAKVHLPLMSYYNNVQFGCPNAGIDMTFDFPTLLAHAAKTRALAAGAIIGSGTVSNNNQAVGSSCLAEKRMLQIIEHGSASTPFMAFGDQIRIEMICKNGSNVFGSIDQQVVQYHAK